MGLQAQPSQQISGIWTMHRKIWLLSVWNGETNIWKDLLHFSELCIFIRLS